MKRRYYATSGGEVVAEVVTIYEPERVLGYPSILGDDDWVQAEEVDPEALDRWEKGDHRRWLDARVRRGVGLQATDGLSAMLGMLELAQAAGPGAHRALDAVLENQAAIRELWEAFHGISLAEEREREKALRSGPDAQEAPQA